MPVAPTPARLVATAAACGFVASFVSAVFVDPVFYNPDARFPAVVERLRRAVGPSAALLTAAVTVSASWPGSARSCAALLSAAVALVQVRISETDRALRLAEERSRHRAVAGRREVTGALHTMVGAPLVVVKRLALERVENDRCSSTVCTRSRAASGRRSRWTWERT
jgi:hypothetical protein